MADVLDSVWERILPPTVEVRETKNFGRGVYAKVRISQGTEIAREEPYIRLLNMEAHGKCCDKCFKSSSTLLKCSRCNFVRYCGKDCQTRDLPLHKSECAGLANYRQHIAHYPPEIIEPARLLIRLLEKTAANRSSKDLPRGVQCWMDLLCSVPSYPPQYLVNAWLTVAENMREKPFEWRVGAELLRKAQCNMLGFRDYISNKIIGSNLFIGFSLLNHSCEHNCLVVDHEGVGCLRAVRTVEPGEQLLISYVNPLETYRQRQACLQKYDFICCCQMCSTELQSDSLYKMKYATVENKQIPASVRDKEMDQVTAQCCTIREIRDAERRTRACEALVKEQKKRKILHPMNLANIDVLDIMMRCYEELNKIPEALKVAKPLTEIYRQKYVASFDFEKALHAIRTCSLLAKMKIQNEETYLAIVTKMDETPTQSLKKAMEILTIDFGSDHYFTIHNRQKVDEILQQLS